jgi:hypothetical protein
MTVIMSATMCMKEAAPWKMIVFANSMFRAKQSASIPKEFEVVEKWPTTEHTGTAAAWHIESKSPKPILSKVYIPLFSPY